MQRILYAKLVRWSNGHVGLTFGSKDIEGIYLRYKKQVVMKCSREVLTLRLVELLVRFRWNSVISTQHLKMLDSVVVGRVVMLTYRRVVRGEIIRSMYEERLDSLTQQLVDAMR